jgi:GT2 family glycosyltransferase
MTTQLPFVSVVIPTQDRLPLLRQCLEALNEQDYPAERMEVIVVADGCSDGTAAVLSDASFAFPLRVLVQEASGAAAARNRGAKEARGELLLFLDDDVIASPGLVTAHVAAHGQDGERVVVGPYLIAPPDGNDFTVEALATFWEKTFAAMARPDRVPSFGDLLSGNLSLGAAIFERLGRFNPAFPDCGIEDYEFGVRVVEKNIPILLAPAAYARHLETTNLRRSLARNRRGGSSVLILAELHPTVLPTERLLHIEPWVRHLVFRRSRLGEWLAELGYLLLVVAQRLRLRRVWRYGYGHLRTYWFWRGVRDRVGTEDVCDSVVSRLRRDHRPRTGGKEIPAAPITGTAQEPRAMS